MIYRIYLNSKSDLRNLVSSILNPKCSISKDDKVSQYDYDFGYGYDSEWIGAS